MDSPRKLSSSEMTPGVFVNPGAGPITGSRLENALMNIGAFVLEAGHPNATVTRIPEKDEGGRYAFLVVAPDVRAEVLMPGWPLDEVRFLGEPGQNPWAFPRLYVNGGSWLWKYALDLRPEVD